MKILCLSDLHLSEREISSIFLGPASCNSPVVGGIFSLLRDEDPDGVIITGDTVSNYQLPFLPNVLVSLFGKERKIFFCLGNHEFWGNSWENTLKILRVEKELKEFSNLYFLDLGDSFCTGNTLFIGGTLFFDGSMRFRESQTISPWNGWQDFRIKNIEKDYSSICSQYRERFKQQILEANEKFDFPSVVLCTHHLSDKRLNGHTPSVYSFYSGVDSLIPELPLTKGKEHWFVCGHTHRRVITPLEKWVNGVNVGSDYGHLKSFIFEVE